MSQLLDALRKRRDDASNTDMSAPLELAPLAPPADVVRHPSAHYQRIAPSQSPERKPPTRNLPPPPTLFLAALAGGLVAGGWLFLMSAPLVAQPAFAMPPVQLSPVDEPQASTLLPPPVPANETPTNSTPIEAPRQPIRPPHHTQRTPPAITPNADPQFRRNSAPARPIAQALDDAFKAYSAGDLTSAETRYRQALSADPRNPDALLGLGATALAAGRLREAEAHFQRALANRPQDPVALAGLNRVHPTSAQTSRLREILQDRSDALPRVVAQLALAESLAHDGRWAEAQQAYFDAHRLAPNDANIAYNLAVSLDHLGHGRSAVRYYARALQLASPPGHARFSREQCAARLTTLSATP